MTVMGKMGLRTHRLAPIVGGQGAALALLGVPAGVLVSDGRNTVTATVDGIAVDVSRWQLDAIGLWAPAGAQVPDALELLVTASDEGVLVRRRFSVPVRAARPACGGALIGLQGLPKGALLTDGEHTVRSDAESALHDLHGWRLDEVSLELPRGYHDRVKLRIVVDGLDREQLAALGALRLRLKSPNAYLQQGDSNAPASKLPAMEIVVGNVRDLALRSAAAVLPGGGQKTGAAALADGVRVLSDDELEALEQKLRGGMG